MHDSAMWWQATCHLLAIILQLRLGSSQSHCQAGPLLLRAGIIESTIPVPKLVEGARKRWACGEFFDGYESFIEVSCLGGKLHGDSSRCSPRGCKSGDRAPVRIGGINVTLYATLERSLEHGLIGRVSCDTILKGYTEVIELTCKFGGLAADAGTCRPAFKDASTVVRIVNGDFLPGTWRIFELSFYLNADCETGKLEGRPVASSEHSLSKGWKELAFDRDFGTAWSANCELGCQVDTAWAGLILPQPSANVRCIQLRQSQVKCCGSDRVRAEVWDGSEFQVLQMWDTSTMEVVRHSFELPVPISCVQKKPEGEGVDHDCDGPPVVGLQRGDVCTARCQTGYYGTPQEFVCQADGTFIGVVPTCYELESWIRFGTIISIWATLIGLAWQYKFWCMFKKVRLNGEEVSIPNVMQGKWLEHNGREVWDDMVNAVKDKEKKAAMIEGAPTETGEPHKSADEMQHDATVHAVAAVGPSEFMEAGPSDGMQEMVQMVMHHGRLKPVQPSTDGLCTPCADPDLCWSCLLCPLCRIADTWHTLGTPAPLTYWRVFMMYLCCPCCWPCFNFYGRLRTRMIFAIPLEPHRDCLAHCCCCCCSPCAICQEARLADAPTRLFWARNKQKEAIERME